MKAAFQLAVLLPLAACADGSAPDVRPPEGVRLACAVAGESVFTDRCTVSRSAGDGVELLTLSAPDGGFRRIAVEADGSTIRAADGAVPAVIGRAPGGEIEVGIASDRYRLPAAGA